MEECMTDYSEIKNPALRQIMLQKKAPPGPLKVADMRPAHGTDKRKILTSAKLTVDNRMPEAPKPKTKVQKLEAYPNEDLVEMASTHGHPNPTKVTREALVSFLLTKPVLGEAPPPPPPPQTPE